MLLILDFINSKKLFNENTNSLFSMIAYYRVMMDLTELILQHPNVQTLIHSDEKFDVVVVEQFLNDALKGLAPHFGASLIIFSTVGINNWVNSLVGNPSPPSYISDVSQNYPTNMTFFQRLQNTLLIQCEAFVHRVFVYPAHGELMKKYIPRAPHYSEVFFNASIVLLNSDSSITAAIPKVPSMIDIGGIHILTPKELTGDLKIILDTAKEGVIYFSMGSNLRSNDIPVHKRQAILNTFAKLKQKVLWKWEQDVLPGQPSNVILSKWFPQQDILGKFSLIQ